MLILIATIADIAELTRVEIESKIRSFDDNDEVSINPAMCQYRWETYFAGTSPATSKPERIVYKAVEDGKIIGYIAAHLTNRYDKDAEIQNFYLLKEKQRKGIGTQMLKQLLPWLKQNKARSLCVGIDNVNPYQQFYLKCGGTYINKHWIGWDNITALEAALHN